MTRHDATRPTPSPGSGAAAGQDDGGRVPDELSLVLAQGVVSAVETAGGYAGGIYLRSGTPGLLRLAVLAGLPGPLFRPWWRMHVNRPFPVSEAYRTGRPVLLADAEEGMRRFPQLMAGLPFPFGSLWVPITGPQGSMGVMAVLRSATPGEEIAPADGERLLRLGHRLGAALTDLESRSLPVVWEKEPIPVQLPAAPAPPVRVGSFDWDLHSGGLTADDDLCAIFGTEPAEFPGTVDALAERLVPEDVYGLWALARQAVESADPVVRRMRLRGPDGRYHLLELSGRWIHPDGESAESHLTGFVVDFGAGPVIAEAADRLPRGIVSLDRIGRITYANELAEELLDLPRAELVGHVVWEVLPWFAHPAYEDHCRAALISDEPVHFLARRAPSIWLSVSLYPGHDGLSAVFQATERPAYAPGSVTAPGLGIGSTADRSSALYRPVALAIALTEAVTARQVSAVVTEELLPAFGGRQLAIYLLSERHLHLAWETGFPKGFLDRFDGVGLDVSIPGVETLTTGRPIFFESMQRLADAYPGIPMETDVGARAFLPLIASGRPVGSCILGFDRPRGFSPEERTVLTALAGLIAQALQRAQRYDSESALARGLQDALLPHRLPEVDGVDTLGRYLSGTQDMEVGGDWYDVIETGDELALVIGDVQGHGVSAAATMGQLRSAVRAFALSNHDPQEVMSGTNRLLIDLDPGQFASCCYIVLDPLTGQARAVRAGHPQPLLRHPDGRTEVLDLAGGIVLGIDGQATYPVTELRLDPGDVLALFTDGLIERPGTDIDEGIERLRATIAGVGPVPLAELANRVTGEARQATDRPDDIAILLAARWTHLPEKAPQPSRDTAPPDLWRTFRGPGPGGTTSAPDPARAER
ncbi:MULTISPECIES: SpoIIE family protein phosphatase [Streptomyces]|uniref:SpoIIE family protein phosphatase n=1 Tax=Streptomyces TaxID=1883 RepID=UPI00192A0B64|nr:MULTISPECIES: SpoIIE family protein phosphatase [unclassified Streptomyces]CAD5914916.1 Phosphoserine phosphatase RsbU [Streptomyces sp. KY70]CAD5993798.1 Phosphoserine phosphatase RsbU [Streptomyces sp. KY75]